ncbi:MAG TPA: hypothetical protein VNX17_01835 [Edaphobacter sp.]|nr:hypothetical protein [Edaphobacter sp.]
MLYLLCLLDFRLPLLPLALRLQKTTQQHDGSNQERKDRGDGRERDIETQQYERHPDVQELMKFPLAERNSNQRHSAKAQQTLGPVLPDPNKHLLPAALR